MLEQRRILLIIGGGIAAYKCLDLIRRLGERGSRIRVILTRAGAEFVTPLSISAVSGDKIYSDLFSRTDEAEMGHIRLSREADLVVVAPATADLIAKMASGLADDLASTTLLATDKPVMIVPSMNVRMWRHPATRRNVATLEADGILRVGPDKGDLACGEEGEGRLSEVADIVAAIDRFFDARGISEESGKGSGGTVTALPALSRKTALVTAGPTFEAIDPVRYIANRSSGKQGFAIAAELAALGAKTTLISGPVQLADPEGVEVVRVESAAQMLAACEQALPVDIAVCVAAVADWRVAEEAAQKIKKSDVGAPEIKLTETEDILRRLSSAGDNRPALVIGFAAETENVAGAARAKRKSKGCDWILANDVSAASGVLGGDFNTVELITPSGAEAWPKATKHEIAERLARRVATHFADSKRGAA